MLSIIFLSVISTRTPRAGSVTGRNADWRRAFISIRTPRVGSVADFYQPQLIPQNFNPHSPCGERIGPAKATRPVWNFNPHSPCGERNYQQRKSELYV